jgi:hypothetical protein
LANVNGNNNTIINQQIPTNINISGSNNNVAASYITIDGDTNIVSYGTTKAYIYGNNNNIINGIIVQDLSSYTNSGPSTYVDPYSTTSTKLYIKGNNNIIGTYSNGIYINGDSNTIAASASNVYLFGNHQSNPPSNQFTIGSDLDLNIKGAVLPCNLIQNYTPTSNQDEYGVSGFMTKDNENIWVKTTQYGWRQIPFNNSFGSFFDVTTQTNPTASTVNAIILGSQSVSSNVSIQNKSHIYVVYSGLYNLQFSAQLNKSGGGTSEIDIWFRYNGNDITWSNTRLYLQGNNAKSVAAWNFVQEMEAGTYMQIMWSSADTGVSIYAETSANQPTRPGIPSVIVTMDKISSI